MGAQIAVDPAAPRESAIAAPMAAEASDAAEPLDQAESFEGFYRGQVDRVYRALAITLGDSQLAREAADEAMARAYAHWRRVRRLDNPGGWAYRVGLNWATSWWRKVRRERALGDDRRDPVVPAPDPTGTAAREALARLELPQRAVVVCRVLLDFSTAETAVLLGLAEGTVKSRLARSLRALRSALTDEDALTEEKPS
jgi:RNA polymerase sigma-70 factor (ECF subfamily)